MKSGENNSKGSGGGNGSANGSGGGGSNGGSNRSISSEEEEEILYENMIERLFDDRDRDVEEGASNSDNNAAAGGSAGGSNGSSSGSGGSRKREKKIPTELKPDDLSFPDVTLQRDGNIDDLDGDDGVVLVDADGEVGGAQNSNTGGNNIHVNTSNSNGNGGAEAAVDDALLGISITPRKVMKSDVGQIADRPSPTRNKNKKGKKKRGTKNKEGGMPPGIDANAANGKDVKEGNTTPETAIGGDVPPFFSDGSVLTGDPDLHSTTGSLVDYYRRRRNSPAFCFCCKGMTRKNRRLLYAVIGVMAFLGLAAVVLGIVFSEDLEKIGSKSPSSSTAASEADSGGASAASTTNATTAAKKSTLRPTTYPTATPSLAPQGPTAEPTSAAPTTPGPTSGPTLAPTAGPTTPRPTPSPTAAPTQTPDPIDVQLANAVGPGRATLLSDDSTPQGKATRWMLNHPARNDIFNPTRTVQRYSLLSMYFGFLEGDDDFVVEAADGATTTTTALNYTLVNADMAERFNINGTTDECTWTGVTCNNATNEVEKIVWADMDLQGGIVDDVGLLRNLTYLDLGENEIGGTLPMGLYSATNLRNLYLHQNEISGTLSDHVANLTRLEKLYLGNNDLTGTIPRGLGSPKAGGANVRPLRYINLHRNQLTGTIPENLNLRMLFYLDLSYNSISGKFPNDWVEGSDTLQRIRHIYLDNNQMSGTLPQNLQSIGNGRLETLLLANNRFTGTMPGDYELHRMMQQMEIQNNYFTDMDSSLCSLIVFEGGELVNFRADCEICDCRFFCGSGECY